MLAPVPDAVAPVPDVVAPVPDVVAPVPDAVAPVPDVVAPVPDAVAPIPDAVAPVPDAVAPVPDAVAPVPDAVAPVPDAVAPVPDAVAPVPDAVAPVPDVVAPISDVIVFLQNMLTAAASAVVPLTQLQCDLFSWFSSLFGIASVQPVVVGLGGAAGAGPSAASADASVAPQSPLVRALAGIRGVPLAGKATGVAAPEGITAFTFGAMTQIGRASPLAGVAPLAPNGAIPTDVQPFFRDACELLHTRFTVDAGNCRPARPRRASDPYSNRGAHRIPPGQSRFRGAASGHSEFRSCRGVRCRPFWDH